MNDNINIKNIIKGKSIALIILMILACSLLTGDTSIIIPSILFIGIVGGIIKKGTMNEVLLSNFLAFVIGSILTMIVSLINVYYSEGGLYAIAVIQYSWIYIIFYTFIGCVGSAIGFYIKEEIDNRG
ncbi:MAG: hypothetical protein VZR33_00880 [Methanosphaera sp.]|uniref:hypothetical protein n=1 Tax=Methanosphaera sp. TaxID=2666342 RepID=UPI002E76ED29|nr:hypothetical protein [Methanosphaera sp.]MEE1116728.1 hypothetical protein [Methanosphaera sp.]MEE3323860.1 hypothetical protein [Methanosphaera sp.]MEE3418510.1 hypothetical protein [Methanosphaera sp.]